VKIVVFGNGKVALEAMKWFREQGEEVAGLVLHPETSRRMGNEIISAAGLSKDRIFDASLLRQAGTIDAIRALKADIGVSVFFGYILKRELLDLFPRGCVNVHPALLPFNRGAYPNVWSIVEGTPAGVTIHYIDEGVDTGDIISQREVAVEPVDTGETLYRKLEERAMELLSETWPEIINGRAVPRPQPRTGGSAHRMRDVEQIDEIDLDKQYKARDLINILRARTFPPYRGAYFVKAGRKILVTIQLRYDDAAK
jgi:methionyl-tRNA formyltransferase